MLPRLLLTLGGIACLSFARAADIYSAGYGPGSAPNTCSICRAGTYGGGLSGCLPCPANTNSTPGSSSISSCLCNARHFGQPGSACALCTPGVHYPELNSFLRDTTGNAACDWDCIQATHYRPGDGSIVCLSRLTTDSDALTVQGFAVVLDRTADSWVVRVSNISSAHQTTETAGSFPLASGELGHPAVSPDGLWLYMATGSSALTLIVRLSLLRPFDLSAMTIVAGGLTAGNLDGPALQATLSGVSSISPFLDGSGLLFSDQSGGSIKVLSFPHANVTTVKSGLGSGSVVDVKLSKSGSFAVVGTGVAIYRLDLATKAYTLIAGGNTAYQDGAGPLAKFLSFSVLALSGDDLSAFVCHAHPTDATLGTLRRADIASGQVTTLASFAWLKTITSLSGSLAADRIWALSTSNREFYQLLISGASASLELKFGDSSAAAGTADDVMQGATHTETFYSPQQLALWKPRKPGHDGVSSFESAPACARGLYTLGDTGCLSCPRGTQSSDLASSYCAPCPDSTYSAAEASLSCTNCTSAGCGLGEYKHSCGAGSAGTCSPCPLCPAGTRRTGCGGFSMGTCEPCPSAPAVNQYYSSECTISPCTNSLPAGQYWNQSGWGSPTCLSAPCANKPLNSYYTASENFGPTCGYACLDGHETSSCTPCAQGYFSRHPSTPACAPCAAGTFSPSNASSSCFGCSPGTIAPSQGSSACSPCNPGYFNPSALATQCFQCPSGSVSPRSSPNCTSCQAGSFANASEPSRCYPCPTGRYSAPASFFCSACPAGAFTPTNTGPCQQCSPGYFSSEGSTACSACPPSTFASQSSSSACTPCVQGVHYPPNSYPIARNASTACAFACSPGYTKTVTQSGEACSGLDPSKPYFAFTVLVTAASLTASQVESYAVIIAAALGVDRGMLTVSLSQLVQSAAARRLLATEVTIYIAVEATSQQNAIALSAQISTSTFLYNVNLACQLQGLASAIVDATTLTYVNVDAPPSSPPSATPSPPNPSPPSPSPGSPSPSPGSPSPSPGSPPPPPGIDVGGGGKSESGESSQPPAVLLAFFCLFALAYILPHQEDYD